MKLFGPEFNASWEEAGFPDQSPAIPRTLDPRFTPLARGNLLTFFHPSPAARAIQMMPAA